MLQPKRTKFRNNGQQRGVAWSGSDVSFGDFALQSMGQRLDHRPPNRSGPHGDSAAREARRQAVDPHLPDKPITKKPLEVRMGSGKGGVEGWVAVVKRGRVLAANLRRERERGAGRIRARFGQAPHRNARVLVRGDL